VWRGRWGRTLASPTRRQVQERSSTVGTRCIASHVPGGRQIPTLSRAPPHPVGRDTSGPYALPYPLHVTLSGQGQAQPVHFSSAVVGNVRAGLAPALVGSPLHCVKQRWERRRGIVGTTPAVVLALACFGIMHTMFLDARGWTLLGGQGRGRGRPRIRVTRSFPFRATSASGS
jgi:hypothetical protein